MRAWLEVYPELKGAVRGLDALSEKAEAGRVGGTDALAQAAARDEVAALKGELLGANLGVLDKLLAGAVVVAHLAHFKASVQGKRPADRRLVR